MIIIKELFTLEFREDSRKYSDGHKWDKGHDCDVIKQFMI